MIWGLGILLGAVVGLYLAAPFLAKETSAPHSEELEAYRAELREIEQSEDTEDSKKAIIRTRLLQAAKANTPVSGRRSLAITGLICAAIVGGSVGIYALIGSPNFTPEVRQSPPIIADNTASDYTSLLPRFEERLAATPEDATGWYLYGRTLMLAGDHEAGLRAYETALELIDTPEIRKEYEAAKRFADQVKAGPSAEDIAAMQNLSPEERTAAIEGMVESLRTRLTDDPNNAEGWTRLLRSRKVLGQIEAGNADIETLRSTLPDQAETIIAQSGWNN